MKKPILKYPVKGQYLVNKYLELILTNSERLTTAQTRKAFILILEDYFAGKVSRKILEHMSADLLYGFGNSPGKLDRMDSDLSGALQAGSEINYYYENKEKDEETKKWYTKWEEIIKCYYEKHKSFK